MTTSVAVGWNVWWKYPICCKAVFFCFCWNEQINTAMPCRDQVCSKHLMNFFWVNNDRRTKSGCIYIVKYLYILYVYRPCLVSSVPFHLVSFQLVSAVQFQLVSSAEFQLVSSVSSNQCLWYSSNLCLGTVPSCVFSTIPPCVFSTIPPCVSGTIPTCVFSQFQPVSLVQFHLVSSVQFHLVFLLQFLFNFKANSKESNILQAAATKTPQVLDSLCYLKSFFFFFFFNFPLSAVLWFVCLINETHFLFWWFIKIK